MSYSILSRIDSTLLSIENIMVHIRALPEISQGTRNIFMIAKQRFPIGLSLSELSRERIIQKTNEYEQKIERLVNLESHQCQHQCTSMSRAALNVSCLAGTALFGTGVLGPDFLNRILGSFGFFLGYVMVGSLNYYCENPERPEEEEELWIGTVCGPCFAVREAVYRVPERILQLQREVVQAREDIISDFQGLIALGQYREGENPLRKILVDAKCSLQTEIDDFAKTVISLEVDRFKGSAKTMMERVVTEQEQKQQMLKRKLESYKTALLELDRLILHIQRRILPQVVLSITASSVAVPVADSDL